MSRGVNKVILVGRLGQDPEVRYMPNGNAVANISLATSDSWKDKNTGQQQERTEWHRVVVFGKLGEVAGEYLRKGSQVYFEGRLQTRKWTDQQGQEKYTTEIVIDMGGQMQMLDSKQDGAQQQPQQQQAQGGFNGQQQKAQQNQYQQAQQGGFNQNQQQGGFAPQQGGFAPKPQSAPQGGASNPMEPPIDFDDDIPF